MCNVNVPYVMKKLRHLHHSPVLQHNTLNLMATLMGENVKFPWWLNFFPHPCHYFLVTIVVSFTCPCLEHATYKSSSLSSTTSWASTTISIFNQFFSFIKTHVWCKHSSLDTLDLVFGGFFATTSNWVVLYAPTVWWLIVCVVYVFRPMEKWWFELVVWIVWKNIIATYNQTYLHMAIFKGVMHKISRIFFVALKCNMLLKTWASFIYYTKLNLWFSRYFTNNMSLLN